METHVKEVLFRSSSGGGWKGGLAIVKVAATAALAAERLLAFAKRASLIAKF